MKRILTGIKPTGQPHLGNYIGSIKPMLQLEETGNEKLEKFYFIADLHALNQMKDRRVLKDSIYEIAASYLALGLNPDECVFYKQSDILEISELFVILASICSKGLMNRAHAYKALVEENTTNSLEVDNGINMGLFTYPILMAADILAFNADLVPVGADQLQHIEIARDLAGMFNFNHKEIFILPVAHTEEKTATLQGLDGRKMSKSYNNVIPILAPENVLKKKIKQIVTDSSAPNEPKNYDASTIGSIYNNFATKEEIEVLKEQFEKGISWNDAKEELFRVVNRELKEPRQRYEELIKNKKYIDDILETGANRARFHAQKTLAKVKKTLGISR